MFCGTRQCAGSIITRTHQTALLRRLLHLGVQQRLEVLHEEHESVGPADCEAEVLPAVLVVGEAAHDMGPLLELHLVGRVVVVFRTRRRLRHRPENENERRLDPLKTGENRR